MADLGVAVTIERALVERIKELEAKNRRLQNNYNDAHEVAEALMAEAAKGFAADSVGEWLMFDLFSRDHDLYDAIMSLPPRKDPE